MQNLLPFDKNGALAPQWGDPRVWKALSIAIDREAYVNAVHPGEIPTANALPADSPGYIPELEDEYAYDPEAAKDLLAEAGYPDGFAFEFIDQRRQSQRDLGGDPAVLGGDRRRRHAEERGVHRRDVRRRADQPVGGPIALTWTNPLGQRVRRAVRLRQLPQGREPRRSRARPARTVPRPVPATRRRRPLR